MNKQQFGFLLYKNSPEKFKKYFNVTGSVAEAVDKATKEELQLYYNTNWDYNEVETNNIMSDFVALYGPGTSARFDYGSIADLILGGSKTEETVTETKGNAPVIIIGAVIIAAIIGFVIYKY